LSTCYAHQSRILVGLGQWVRRGQVIGRVGTTGASTGNHLHFEVRLDGTPTNPLRWLPACLC
jgi:murein DD-endopeptidase MepM/ murein hydrolase activator NlpD